MQQMFFNIISQKISKTLCVRCYTGNEQRVYTCTLNLRNLLITSVLWVKKGGTHVV
jgi:hypothetical protein